MAKQCETEWEQQTAYLLPGQNSFAHNSSPIRHNGEHKAINSNSALDIGSVHRSSRDTLQLAACRKLVRGQLATLRVLFRNLTGLELFVAWTPGSPRPWAEQDLPTHSGLCRQMPAGSPSALTPCQNCGLQHLELTLKAEKTGHQFLCPLGVRNFWVPIIAHERSFGLACVQSLDGVARENSARRLPANHATWAGAGPKHSKDHQTTCRPMTSSEFKRAARLLQLMLQHAETAAIAELRLKDLTQTRQALRELQTVMTRLRQELNGLVPGFNKNAPHFQPEKHAEQMVHAAMDYIHQHYRRPMTLQQCAAALSLNAAYLSTLFARKVGLSFKRYLTDVRLEKARVLLNDPLKNIAEVAREVGYASENRFRSAFKKLTGLSPSSWRDTFRATLPVLLSWSLQELDCLELLQACCLL